MSNEINRGIIRQQRAIDQAFSLSSSLSFSLSPSLFFEPAIDAIFMRARVSILSVISLSISLVSVALSYFKRFLQKEKF